LEIDFTGERIVPGAANCEPTFAQKMYQEHVARYAFAAQLVRGQDVLDVGCGVGYGSQWLAKSGAKSVLGIDIAKDAIGHAKKNYFHPAVSFRIQDATTIDFVGEFDVVTCFEFIEHIGEQRVVLDAIRKALRPNGQLVISTPRPLDDKRTHFHIHELEYEELNRLLAERFANVESFFERNCFTSFVGAEMPESLERIVKVTDRLELDNADYFLFVAHVTKDTFAESLKPVLTVNDDSYVLRLEDDIVNLRNGENYHNQLINDLTGKSKELSQQLGNVQSELAIQRERAESIDVLRDEASKIFAEVSGLRDELRSSSKSISDEVAVIRKELKSSVELASSRAEIDNLRRSRDGLARDHENLAAENVRIRTVLSKVAQQLAETETRLNAKLAEADLVANLRSELAAVREAHASEMHTLNERYEQAERTLMRFRGSVSWSVTRPIRWIGRQYRKAIGRSIA
jgi:SAM-dependent methyltransferase